MNLRTALVAGIALSIAIAITPAHGYKGKFPGRGNRVSWERAATIFDQAIDAESNKRTQQAIDLYRRSIQLYPYDPSFFGNLALVLERDRGDINTAERLFRKAIALAPNDSNFRLGLIGCLVHQSKCAEAKKELAIVSSLTLTTDERNTLKRAVQLITKCEESKDSHGTSR